MAGQRRTVGARVLLVLATLCLVGGMAAGLVNREILDGPRFADHVDAVRTDPEVADAVGVRITDELLARDPDLVTLRPLLEAAASDLVSGEAFGSVVRAAVLPLHRALVTGTPDDVVMTLANVGVILSAVASAASPEAGLSVPPAVDVTLARIGSGQVDGRLVSAAHTTTVLAWLLPLLWVVLTAVAVLVSGAPRPDRLRAFGRSAAVTMICAAAVSAVCTLAITIWARQQDPSSLEGAVVRASWDELDDRVWAAVALVAAVGYVTHVAATRWHGPLTLAGVLAWLGRWLSVRPARPREQLVRVLVLGVAGLALLSDPIRVLAIAGACLGFVVVVHAALDLGRLGIDLLAGHRRPTAAERVRHLAPAMAGIGAAVALVVLAGLGTWPAGDRVPAASASRPGCNGHVELCQRRYDAVAYPATHNSMSAADEHGWFFAEQPTGVLGQLDDGIRVFLIDSWYGQATGRAGVVATPDADRAASIRQAEAAFGPRAVEAARRLRDTAGLTPRGPAAPYLCHAMCELGSTAWEPLMELVRDWLDQHPGEVVTFIVQDEVTPQDTAEVVEEAGLRPYVHTQVPGKPWPTLGRMVASGRRVVFFMEHRDGGAEIPWLMDVNRWVQDTPFAFTSRKDFTCAPNRGTARAPLLLVNHWLSNLDARVTDAERVNAGAVLDARLEDCRRDRGMLPNFVAVDFYDRGDVFGVVDRLNGVTMAP